MEFRKTGVQNSPPAVTGGRNGTGSWLKALKRFGYWPETAAA
jgi:hypothetical protein